MLTRPITRLRASCRRILARKPRYEGNHVLDHKRPRHNRKTAAIGVAAAIAALTVTGITLTSGSAQGAPDVAVRHAVARLAAAPATAVQYDDGKAFHAAATRSAAASTAAGLAERRAVTLAAHRAHLAHLAHLRILAARARAAAAPASAVGTPASGSRPVASPVVSLSGTLSCSGLEALWRAAGGRSGAAFTAAEIAMAESGGRQYAHSPTNDFGYWQINGSHGPAMATYNPLGNARAAISISGDGSNWGAWTTWTSGAYRGKCSGTSLTSVTTVTGSGRAGTALAWALTQAGKWYSWGGAGPSVYDCSGLVMVAYQHAGISLPHNTVMMLNSGHLHRTYSPRPGDLVMWGGGSPYHVEFWASSGRTFGAHQSGERIGYASLWGSYAFYTVS